MSSLDEKRKRALAYLGTKHVLHPHYDGKVTHDPRFTNVRLTVKREQRRLKQEAEAPRSSVILFRK